MTAPPLPPGRSERVSARSVLVVAPHYDDEVLGCGGLVVQLGSRMIDVANTIVTIAGRGHVEHVEWPALAQQIETGDFVADISRARRELDWQPKWALRDGLEDAIAYYRAAHS